jgi:hypothetical protein
LSKISDVAKRAGVSPVTVSRVINNAKSVSPATREKVQQAIEQPGYFPNVVARTRALALLVPDIANPFWTSVPAAWRTPSKVTAIRSSCVTRMKVPPSNYATWTSSPANASTAPSSLPATRRSQPVQPAHSRYPGRGHRPAYRGLGLRQAGSRRRLRPRLFRRYYYGGHLAAQFRDDDAGRPQLRPVWVFGQRIGGKRIALRRA